MAAWPLVVGIKLMLTSAAMPVLPRPRVSILSLASFSTPASKDLFDAARITENSPDFR